MDTYYQIIRLSGSWTTLLLTMVYDFVD